MTMNQETAEDVARTLKRKTKYNRRVKVIEVVHHRNRSVVQCVHKVTDNPLTISKDSVDHVEERIQAAKSPPEKLRLTTRHGTKLT